MTEGCEVLVAVVEQRAEWPSCMEAIREGIPNVVVVAQQPREAMLQLVGRVERRLRALAREGRGLRAAVLLTSRHHGEATFRARCHAARCLMSSLEPPAHCDAPLWICAPESPSAALCEELLAVAEELAETTPDFSRIAIRLRLRGQRPERSGASVTALAQDALQRSA